MCGLILQVGLRSDPRNRLWRGFAADSEAEDHQQPFGQHLRFHFNVSCSKTAPPQCAYVLRCDTVTVRCSMASGSESCNCFASEVESMYNAHGISD